MVPGAVGVYTGGGNYNPAQVLRDGAGARSTGKLDKLLEIVNDKNFAKVSIAELQEFIRLTVSDEDSSEHVWDPLAIAESLKQAADILDQEDGYVFVDRDRDLRTARRETQGILSGGEAGMVPADRVTVFMMRTKSYGNQQAVWWPQVRFPAGRYALAFAI
jgi:hypothetical protein